jgi:hypothetical protein
VDNTLSNGIQFREPPPPPLPLPPRDQRNLELELENLKKLQCFLASEAKKLETKEDARAYAYAPKTKGSVPDLQEEMIEAKLQLAGLRDLLKLEDPERKREREREKERGRQSEKMKDQTYVAQVAVPATASAATLEATGVAVDQELPQVRSPSADAPQPHLLAGARAGDGPDKDAVASEQQAGIGTIGLLIWPIETQNALVISDTKKASSACVSGLRVGDILVEVDRLPVDASMVKEVVEKLKGPLGSTIQLTVLRKDSSFPTPVDTVVVRDVPLAMDAKGGAKGDSLTTNLGSTGKGGGEIC